jgi:hypothetical protein
MNYDLARGEVRQVQLGSTCGAEASKFLERDEINVGIGSRVGARARALEVCRGAAWPRNSGRLNWTRTRRS